MISRNFRHGNTPQETLLWRHSQEPSVPSVDFNTVESRGNPVVSCSYTSSVVGRPPPVLRPRTPRPGCRPHVRVTGNLLGGRSKTHMSTALTGREEGVSETQESGPSRLRGRGYWRTDLRYGTGQTKNRLTRLQREIELRRLASKIPHSPVGFSWEGRDLDCVPSVVHGSRDQGEMKRRPLDSGPLALDGHTPAPHSARSGSRGRADGDAPGTEPTESVSEKKLRGLCLGDQRPGSGGPPWAEPSTEVNDGRSARPGPEPNNSRRNGLYTRLFTTFVFPVNVW